MPYSPMVQPSGRLECHGRNVYMTLLKRVSCKQCKLFHPLPEALGNTRALPVNIRGCSSFGVVLKLGADVGVRVDKFRSVGLLGESLRLFEASGAYSVRWNASVRSPPTILQKPQCEILYFSNFLSCGTVSVQSFQQQKHLYIQRRAH